MSERSSVVERSLLLGSLIKSAPGSKPAALTAAGVLFCQPEGQRGGALCDAWPTGPAVRIGPALGDEIAVPAQQVFRLHEEALEM
jgi:hypothetical protein